MSRPLLVVDEHGAADLAQWRRGLAGVLGTDDLVVRTAADLAGPFPLDPDLDLLVACGGDAALRACLRHAPVPVAGLMVGDPGPLARALGWEADPDPLATCVAALCRPPQRRDLGLADGLRFAAGWTAALTRSSPFGRRPQATVHVDGVCRYQGPADALAVRPTEAGLGLRVDGPRPVDLVGDWMVVRAAAPLAVQCDGEPVSTRHRADLRVLPASLQLHGPQD